MDKFNVEEIINSLNIDKSSYSNQELLDMASAIAKRNYEYLSKHQKNFSEESEKIMEMVKMGHIPSDNEVFEIITEQSFLDKHATQLEQKKKFADIKRRVQDKHIILEDFNYLVDLMGLDEQMTNKLKEKFIEEHILISGYTNDIEKKTVF